MVRLIWIVKNIYVVWSSQESQDKTKNQLNIQRGEDFDKNMAKKFARVREMPIRGRKKRRRRSRELKENKIDRNVLLFSENGNPMFSFFHNIHSMMIDSFSFPIPLLSFLCSSLITSYPNHSIPLLVSFEATTRWISMGFSALSTYMTTKSIKNARKTNLLCC